MPANWGCASTGAPGSAMAQQHLRAILAYLDMPTLGQPEVYLHATRDTFTADGRIARPDTETFLLTWMTTFVAWVEAHARQAYLLQGGTTPLVRA